MIERRPDDRAPGSMQRAGSEEGEGLEGGPRVDEREARPQEGPDEAAEGPLPPEDETDDDSAPQPHLALSGADENSPVATDSVQDNAAQVQVTFDLSNMGTSEDVEDQELPEDEDGEELILLDPEHPLVREEQAALNNRLRKQLERLDLQLQEKLAEEKADTRLTLEMGFEMSVIQEQLARLHTRLEDHHQTKAQAEAKCRQAQDQLEEVKGHHSSTLDKHSKATASVSQLQVELDKLILHLDLTQGVSDDLRSNVKAMKNARCKAGTEKSQAEKQKLKQDLYVERLMKDLERLTQQIAMYEAQTSAQAEETQAAKQAHSEAEMEMESLVMVRRQLLQQWNSSLVGMRRRDEAFCALQEAVRTKEHQVILLDREIEGYKKSTTEEQERNETLTLQLNRFQMDAATSKTLISQKQAQYEALQAHYSTSLRILRETENTLVRLTKESNSHQAVANDQRRQLEKESTVRLELEDKILAHMQEKLTHHKAAKYSQRLTSKTAALKKEKISQLWQLENELVAVGLESSEVSQHLESLALTQEALDEEIAKLNKLLTSNQAKISSFIILIEQKQATIASYNRKISEIAASTGHEDLSPMQIKVEALMAQIEEMAVNIKSDQQLWMKRQGTLVGLTQDIQADRKNMLKLQKEYTVMQQKKIRLESQIEAEHQELTELGKNVKMLGGDLVQLNTLVSKKGQLSQALEQDNVLMEKDFLQRLKEAERESIEMQMKQEKIQEEKERLLNSLVEAEQQIMLWEKKIQLAKETHSTVDSEVVKGEIQLMKKEIHRMEVRLDQLQKQQRELQREGVAAVERWDNINLRREAMVHNSSHKQQAMKGELSRIAQGLRRKIKDTNRNVSDCGQEIVELQESQENLAERLTRQKQQLERLCDTSYTLERDYVNLQDTRDRNLAHLLSLQSRAKKLQGACGGSYQATSTSERIDAALQRQTERIHAISTIVHSVCAKFPQHQGPLRRLSLALAARTQALDQDESGP
ncbi:coiled-coil domain-containing protein 40 isoform X1 [Scophthalmus maximus]|uniref:coiled-coil domain-containing protein 40 isoform X1 n=2 Tax=Scophthalmus maximus TaxID=52904 RepID=UPI0015E0D726|nr:coiled-coil domain-containing protein 40 isoform X1 [Scophthalmus maximus]